MCKLSIEPFRGERGRSGKILYLGQTLDVNQGSIAAIGKPDRSQLPVFERTCLLKSDRSRVLESLCNPILDCAIAPILAAMIRVFAA